MDINIDMVIDIWPTYGEIDRADYDTLYTWYLWLPIPKSRLEQTKFKWICRSLDGAGPVPY